MLIHLYGTRREQSTIVQTSDQEMHPFQCIQKKLLKNWIFFFLLSAYVVVTTYKYFKVQAGKTCDLKISPPFTRS